ncbi:MAG: hypothetical protein BRC27_00185 [Nanohaloarchaea archaeon SW_10_44_10]|nr:MAG: hypothetical protein BRC27_00185 [Nanohaloarchaea archaeon SW_10_44_10]
MSVRVWMVFEAIAPEKETVENSMEEHIERLGSDEGVEVSEKEQEDTKEMDNPHPSLEKGYSKVVELEVEFDDFTTALKTVTNYGPTYGQFIGPENFEMGMKEAQESLQTVADTMHQYTQKGVGGVVVSRETDETA